MSVHHQVLRSPLITEKNTSLRATQNKYVFEVAKKATKVQIRNAVEKIFDVKVEKVTTSIVKGKKKRMGRFSGYQPDIKKAFVKLAEGSTINQFGEV